MLNISRERVWKLEPIAWNISILANKEHNRVVSRISPSQKVKAPGKNVKEGNLTRILWIDSNDFPTAEQTYNYIQAYATHFSLWGHIRLKTEINGIKRNEEFGKWEIESTNSDGQKTKESYDKLVMATAINDVPSRPKIPELDGFKGDVLHSISFKSPATFTKKRVLVVGFGNTAADVATSLIGHASKIYISHRHGAFVVRWTRADQRGSNH